MAKHGITSKKGGGRNTYYPRFIFTSKAGKNYLEQLFLFHCVSQRIAWYTHNEARMVWYGLASGTGWSNVGSKMVAVGHQSRRESNRHPKHTALKRGRGRMKKWRNWKKLSSDLSGVVVGRRGERRGQDEGATAAMLCAARQRGDKGEISPRRRRAQGNKTRLK